MQHRAICAIVALLAAPGLAYCDDLPLVAGVDVQPFAAQTVRLVEALDMLGEPLSAADKDRVRNAKSAEDIQRVLDPKCLIGIHINPEERVEAREGPAPAELLQDGWRTFLIKVHNEAGITPVLNVASPNGGRLAGTDEPAVARKFLELQLFVKQPMKARLSGLPVDYKILQLYSRDAGKREAKLRFDVGQGTQDLGFRSETDILFVCKPATHVRLEVLDENRKPTTAWFLIRDERGRTYPSQAKRLAPDFPFQAQVYRRDGEDLLLPSGRFEIEYGRGPEYLKGKRTVEVTDRPSTLHFDLQRWIDPAARGWYSGDHHVHAAGCAHYEKPTQGVYPADMMRHILGEDLKVGSVLTWGPGWYFQKTFFEGRDNDLSTPDHRMHYDVEVSGFPSSHTGHIVLLGLKDQDYPGTKRIEDWPSWGVPVFRWAKEQGAVAGFAHSGWGLQMPDDQLPSYAMPPFDGIGANEFIVSVTQGLVNFISTVDTPYPWELNIWYHTLSAGYRTRISGETDFPCIYDDRVGLGRSYVHQEQKKLSYQDWIEGVRDGRNYVSDGKSHIFDFQVNDVGMGEHGSELTLPTPAQVKITAQVAALLPAERDPAMHKLRSDEKPYWDLERARIGDTRKVPVEVVVNGVAQGRREITADGALNPVDWTVSIDRSSWIALRILPSSHTNPIWVTIAGKPVREAKSIEWCLRAVDQCWMQKQGQIRLSERGEAARVYDAARQAYKERLHGAN